MSNVQRSGRGPVALFTALAFAAASAAPPAAAQSPAKSPAPQPSKASPAPAKAPVTAPPTPAPPAPPPPSAVDGGWPREYPTTDGGVIVVYQPQVASWDDQKNVTAYSAVAYEAKGASKPALGSIRLEAKTDVSVENRLVSFTDMKITESNFPSLAKEKVREVVAEIDKAVPKVARIIALDRVLAGLDRSQILPKNIEGVKADPPQVFFSSKPAILVNLDSEPIWSPIKENDLKFAVNTNWDLFQHVPTSTLYLRNESTWLKAQKLEGPWVPAGKLPESFAKLPADDNWKEVKAALPGKSLAAKDVPTVFVSQTPAELILLKGEPAYTPVPGATSLLWVSNTESDVFRAAKDGPVYFLVAGRWFSAPDFTGPWTFATPTLPEDFKKIPLEHPRSVVLASVPGTQQAAEGVLLAQVPQRARVNKKQLKAPEVAYQGEPKFEPIEKTQVSRAVNTDKDIIKVGDLYYMCFQGVWFVSKAAAGPWEVTSSVPKSIYEIPVSSPSHNVTYVTVVEDDDDDDWATFATVAAYTGVMVAWGCAVWGGGYYYPPYYGWGGGYPYYYGHYPTYGYGARYNPWNGTYGRGAVAYGPYGGAGVGTRYNPRTGTYARGAAAYGPGGSRGYAQAYNPRTGAYGATRQGSSVYGSWGTTAVQRGDQWAATSRVTNNRTGQTARVTQTSQGGAVSTSGPRGSAVRTSGGDVYAGRDGNVYRKDSGGGWQQYGGTGSWSNVDRGQAATTRAAGTSAAGSSVGTGTVDQLNRDSSARSSGTQRTNAYGGYRSSGSGRATSYSGGGGGYRGGGGSRGGGGGRRR